MRYRLLLHVVATLYTITPAFALAETLTTTIVSCHDGDTVSAKIHGRVQRIRLAEIDAPETDQPFGAASGARLSQRVVGRKVTIVISDTDRYGRPVATIFLANQSINAEQVKSGMAWVNPRYSRDPALALLQIKARMTGLGLWSEPNPIPPWEWRHAR